MTHKPHAPRREPQQARGKAAVESIKRATAELLEASGFEGLTTQIIADKAGINVATLYRYYPNKFAVVREIAETIEQERLISSIEHLKGLSDTDDWRGLIQETLTTLINLRETRPGARAIRRALQSSPELWDIEHQMLHNTANELACVFVSVGANLTETRAHSIALIIVATVTHLLDVSHDVETNGAELREEMGLLIERYLAPYLDTVSA
ncbi:TetR/AcrR family transcriptional regulator [Leucobacter sp. UCMA 4100]|nr:TetR/AcrR family transcriptional regulator [Leucobacter sp. UCMA 4100]MDA3145970.1 TetR/AcrR family transcriptional regulator [Leucobacter sp. UCMA 4100]